MSIEESGSRKTAIRIMHAIGKEMFYKTSVCSTMNSSGLATTSAGAALQRITE